LFGDFARLFSGSFHCGNCSVGTGAGRWSPRSHGHDFPAICGQLADLLLEFWQRASQYSIFPTRAVCRCGSTARKQRSCQGNDQCLSFHSVLVTSVLSNRRPAMSAGARRQFVSAIFAGDRFTLFFYMWSDRSEMFRFFRTGSPAQRTTSPTNESHQNESRDSHEWD
jgi:hypothetical protein